MGDILVKDHKLDFLVLLKTILCRKVRLEIRIQIILQHLCLSCQLPLFGTVHDEEVDHWVRLGEGVQILQFAAGDVQVDLLAQVLWHLGYLCLDWVGLYHCYSNRNNN